MNYARVTENRGDIFVRSCLESAPGNATAESRPFRSAGASRSPVRLHLLKQKMLRAALQQTTPPRIHKQLCGAANAAAELAWDTAFPLLSFPCLFEERARAIFNRFAHEPPWTNEAAPLSAVVSEGGWPPSQMPIAA